MNRDRMHALLDSFFDCLEENESIQLKKALTHMSNAKKEALLALRVMLDDTLKGAEQAAFKGEERLNKILIEGD